MTTRTRLYRLLALIITCATPGLAQHGGPPQQSVSAHRGQIETSYDPAKDTTIVRLHPMQVYGEPLASSNYAGGAEARFYASFTHPGPASSARPERMLISLISTTGDWKYTDFRKLSAIVDGKRLNLGALEFAPRFTVNAPANANADDNIRQEIAVSLPRRTFLRIANGKEVRIRMGPREFKLGGTHLEALRDLASRMAP